MALWKAGSTDLPWTGLANTTFHERIQMAKNRSGHNLPMEGRETAGTSFGQLSSDHNDRAP